MIRRRETNRPLTSALTVGVLALLVASACSAAPAQRQADRSPTGGAAAIVESVGYSPVRDEVRIATIRHEYAVAGSVEDLAIIVRTSPDVIADLRVGDTVEFSRDDLVGGLESGTVASLPAPGDDVEADRVIIAPPDDGSAGMADDTEVSVVLFGQPRVDVNVVNLASIRDERGQAFIVIEDPDGARRRIDITTGATNGAEAEIVGPVTPGEVVIVP